MPNKSTEKFLREQNAMADARDNGRERRMIEAHKAGRAHAAEVFAAACKAAMDRKGDEEEQFAFLAGLFAELRRITAQKQNEGFRL
jgi:hypothetical protein